MSIQIIGFLFTLIVLNTIISLLKKKSKFKILYCGLIGYSGATPYNAKNLKLIMILNAIDRGADATGFYTPNQGLIKAAEHAKVFLPKTDITESEVFIGHVRAKTVGANLDANAHPFSYRNVVLAHNGTLTNHLSLLPTYNLNYIDFDVDSQCVAGMLNVSMGDCDYANFDPLEYFKPITEIDGAAAFLFKDKRDLDHNRNSRLFAYRNSDRPLHYGFDENRNMYISSIEDPLRAAGLTDITSFDINTVYEIENGEIISETVLPRYEYKSKSKDSNVESIFNMLTKGIFGSDLYELYDTWVQFDLDEVDAKKYGLSKFTKNRFYFVEDIDVKKDKLATMPLWIKVRNNANNLVSVPIFAFNLLYSDFTYSGYAKLLTPITTSKLGKKESLGQIGDIVKIVSVSSVFRKNSSLREISAKMLECKNPEIDTTKEYTLESNWIRPLSLQEVENYLDTKAKTSKQISKKVDKPKNERKVPATVNSLVDFATANYIDLAAEEIDLDPSLQEFNLDCADYIQQVSCIKEEIDDFTMHIIKVLEKRKYALDHNLFSFNDLKPFLMKIYKELNLSADLKSVRNNIKFQNND